MINPSDFNRWAFQDKSPAKRLARTVMVIFAFISFATAIAVLIASFI